MIRHLHLFTTLLALTTSGLCLGQTRVVDSLKLVLKTAKHDSARIQAWLTLGDEIFMQQTDSALIIWNKARALSESNLKKLKENSPEHKRFQNYLADALNNIGYICKIKGDFSLALEYYNMSMELEEKMGDKIGMAVLLTNMGGIYKRQGLPSKTLECLQRSYKLYEEEGDKKGIASSLNALGQVYHGAGNIVKSLEYYGKSLKAREEIGDKRGIGVTLSNIGYIYYEQGEIDRALDYLNKSVNILKEVNDKAGMANSMTKVGMIYRTHGDQKITSSPEEAQRAGIRKALDLYMNSLKIYEELGDKAGIATSLGHIGATYYKYGDPNITRSADESLKADLPKALEYAVKSLEKYEEIGEKYGIANQLNNIGNIYVKLNDAAKALTYAQRSMVLSRELGYPENIRNSAFLLSNVYRAKGNYLLALENYELFIVMRDSISNESTRKASIKQQLKHEYETKAAADSVAHAKESEIKNAELKKQEAEIKAKKNQQYALFGGLTLVMVFAGFMFNRFKVTQKQKTIIELQKTEVEEQKQLVEEKQKEILDSIHYAKRIQLAQIPSKKRVSGMLIRAKK